MNLAIFDLDDTLLAGSCDFIWENYLVKHGFLNKNSINALRKYFIKKYHHGSFNVIERQERFLSQLSSFSLIELTQLLPEFVKKEIPQFIYKKAKELINRHQKQKACLLIISAASSFLVKPIAKSLGIHFVIATEPEVVADHFTGKIVGLPCFSTYKILHLDNWIKQKKYCVEKSYFYSDSVHDLPLLRAVTHPIATNPDVCLKSKAKEYGWRIINLNDKNVDVRL